MKGRFDRVLERQFRCFAIFTGANQTSSREHAWGTTKIIPARCRKAHRILCRSPCPRSSAPVYPEPLHLRRSHQVVFETLRVQRELSLPSRLHSAVRQEQLLTFPESVVDNTEENPWNRPLPPNITYDKRDFRGYDCSEPMDIEPVQIDENPRVCKEYAEPTTCLLYTSPSPRDKRQTRMPSSA